MDIGDLLKSAADGLKQREAILERVHMLATEIVSLTSPSGSTESAVSKLIGTGDSLEESVSLASKPSPLKSQNPKAKKQQNPEKTGRGRRGGREVPDSPDELVEQVSQGKKFRKKHVLAAYNMSEEELDQFLFDNDMSINTRGWIVPS